MTPIIDYTIKLVIGYIFASVAFEIWLVADFGYLKMLTWGLLFLLWILFLSSQTAPIISKIDLVEYNGTEYNIIHKTGEYYYCVRVYEEDEKTFFDKNKRLVIGVDGVEVTTLYPDKKYEIIEINSLDNLELKTNRDSD